MYIGIDIGGTKSALTLADRECNIFKKIRFDTTDRDTTLKQIFDGVSELIALSKGQAKAIGISCGGPLSSSQGVILSPPNLPGWDNVPIVNMLTERFSIPAYLQNDANACAVAEWKFGAGKGSQSMIFLTFGTGLGAGLILGGRLYEGANGNAGELGHIRLCDDGPVGYGKAGSFEGFCSGGGIAQLGKSCAAELFEKGISPSFCPSIDHISRINAKSVAEAAEAGCEDALNIYRTCGEYLGKGLAVVIDLLNPEKIIIGSIYTRSSHLLKEAMEQSLRRECLPESLGVCKILPAKLGESIGDIAALSIAITEYEKENEKC